MCTVNGDGSYIRRQYIPSMTQRNNATDYTVHDNRFEGVSLHLATFSSQSRERSVIYFSQKHDITPLIAMHK